MNILYKIGFQDDLHIEVLFAGFLTKAKSIVAI